MKKLNIKIFLCICLSIMGLAACSSNDLSDLASGDTTGVHTYRMHFDGCIGSYNNGVLSRATMTIADKTKLYLNINGNLGTAIYNSRLDEWSLTYSGSLSGTGVCRVFYITNGTEGDGTVTLTPTSAVYGTSSGTYTYASDGSITLKAILNPMLSRFIVKEMRGLQVVVKGVKVPSSFSLSKGTFGIDTSDMVSVTLDSNGNSKYIYHLGASSESLSIISGSKSFTAKNTLEAGGMSGYIVLPTEDRHGEWVMTDIKRDPEAVDLGLSVKWASFNIGAYVPEQFGDYFAWGETETKPSYDYNSYKVGTLPYLDLEHDVAHVKWGGKWRMPTKEEFDELVEKCTWTWTSQGCKVTGSNGNSVFLPYADWYYDDRNGARPYGFYWSSSANSSYFYQACNLMFGRDNNSLYVDYSPSNDLGLSVRPVCP